MRIAPRVPARCEHEVRGTIALDLWTPPPPQLIKVPAKGWAFKAWLRLEIKRLRHNWSNRRTEAHGAATIENARVNFGF